MALFTVFVGSLHSTYRTSFIALGQLHEPQPILPSVSCLNGALEGTAVCFFPFLLAGCRLPESSAILSFLSTVYASQVSSLAPHPVLHAASRDL